MVKVEKTVQVAVAPANTVVGYAPSKGKFGKLLGCFKCK
jgi:hypothetical protein